MNQMQKALVTGAVFAVLAGGAVGLALWDKNARQGKEEAEKKGKLAFDIKSDDVTRIEVTHEGQRVVAEKKDGSGWQIVEPIVAPGDDGALTGVASTMAGLSLRSRFSKEEVDPAKVGLSAPTETVNVTTKDGKHAQVWLGSKSTFDDGQYVLAGENAAEASVSVTQSYSVTGLQKGLYDLREKRLLTQTSNELDAMEVTLAKPDEKTVSFRATRSGEAGKHKFEDGWTLQQPVEVPGDREELIKIGGSITALRALSFVDETSADLTKWGLAEPFATVKAVLSGKEYVLLYGRVANGSANKYYAKRADIPNVAEIPETDFNLLLRDTFTLRDKRLVDFDRDAVTTISATLPKGGVLTLHKKTDKNGIDEWKLSEPRAAPARAWKATSLLYTLSNLKMRRFVREGLAASTPEEVKVAYGFTTPSRTVTLKDKDGKVVAELIFGKQEGDDVFAMSRGGTSVGAVELKKLEDLPNDVEDYSDEPVKVLGGSDAGPVN